MSAANYDANRYLLMRRDKILVNTDPQRRCYNGACFSCEAVWSEWAVFDRLPNSEIADIRLKFWRDLNDYAVKSHGEDARSEFKINVLEVEEHDVQHLPSDDTEGGAL